MRIRPLLFTVCVCLLIVPASALIVQAQTQSLNERNALWESRAVIGMPEDGDDEGDDESTEPMLLSTTGQTVCSEGVEPYELVDCAGSGQDGEYQNGLSSPGPRFTANGDGTVTDNLTGLIWLQSGNCFGAGTWAEALWRAANLESGACGLTDGSVRGAWRLPNVRELHSLVDYSQTWPALPLDHPFVDVWVGYNCWSSTSIDGYEAYAHTVRFASGGIRGEKKFLLYFSTWPVRGPE